jgi:uncharacterized membrane protein
MGCTRAVLLLSRRLNLPDRRRSGWPIIGHFAALASGTVFIPIAEGSGLQPPFCSESSTRMNFSTLVELLAGVFELGGLAALLIGAIAALVVNVRHVILQAGWHSLDYRNLWQRLGRAILIGLELFVAADIIRNVTIEPTFQSDGVLGLIVLVRTF